jgi:glycosyltransferase involved in cell wall biosynthesis
VIVVDAGSTDGTDELVARRAVGWPALRLLRAPGAPPGQSRNAGVKAATAPIIATVDCGTRIPHGWLAAMVACLLEAPSRLVAGVPVADARSPFESASGWLALRGFKPSGAPSVGAPFRPGGRNGYCFTRSAWDAAGGFPDVRWADDKLFIDRVREAGYEIVPAPAAVLRWRPRTSLLETYRQYRAYGRGDVINGIDLQNELVPVILYATGAVLAARAARGDRRSAVALAAAVTAYLGLFTVRAARELDSPRAVAWVPIARMTIDVGKVQGLFAGACERLRGEAGVLR